MFSVAVQAGTEHFGVKLERVPVAGDFFLYNRQRYEVRSVTMVDGGGIQATAGTV